MIYFTHLFTPVQPFFSKHGWEKGGWGFWWSGVGVFHCRYCHSCAAVQAWQCFEEKEGKELKKRCLHSWTSSARAGRVGIQLQHSFLLLFQQASIFTSIWKYPKRAVLIWYTSWLIAIHKMYACLWNGFGFLFVQKVAGIAHSEHITYVLYRLCLPPLVSGLRSKW